MDFRNHNKLHLGSKGKIFSLAKHLRKDITNAEDILWQEIRNRKLNGLKFRRQHPILKYIADFYCHEIKLVIEIDGSIHTGNEEHDEGRSFEFEDAGIKVIRFANSEIYNDLPGVLNRIFLITNQLI